MQIDYLNQ